MQTAQHMYYCRNNFLDSSEKRDKVLFICGRKLSGFFFVHEPEFCLCTVSFTEFFGKMFSRVTNFKTTFGVNRKNQKLNNTE